MAAEPADPQDTGHSVIETDLRSNHGTQLEDSETVACETGMLNAR